MFEFANHLTMKIFPLTSARRGLYAVAVLVPLMIGCGAPEGLPRVAVRGTVKLDGKELASGLIRFIPTASTQAPAASATIQSGRYEFTEADGPVLGAYRIEIEATEYLGFALDDEAAFAANLRQNRRALPKNPVPDIYNRQSMLRANVIDEGPREFNFELSSNTSDKSAR